MPTPTPLLEARGIGRLHRDGNTWLVRDISLAICAGERVAVTGATGSGKTVLLRSLAMLDSVDEGAILWQGNMLAEEEIPPYRSQSIYLSQRAWMFDGTVEHNLRLPYALAIHRGRAFARETTVADLQRLGRDEQFLAQDAANLSGGETQIVALLRAIQLAPTVLLLDEPTASLDENATRQIEQLVADWMSADDTRRAIVWVTHDAAQASRIASRTVRLRDGKLSEAEANR